MGVKSDMWGNDRPTAAQIGSPARIAAVLSAVLLISACAGERPELKAKVTEAPPLADPSVAAFGHCSGHGCEILQVVGLSDGEWASIRRGLEAAPASAAEERAKVAVAVARFESLTGRKTGTAQDLGGTWPGFLLSGQLDCVDETVNTQTLLRLLAVDGLLRWHRIGRPAGRGSFLDGLPHRTAVLVELDGGTEFAIDSWFYDNGAQPEVVLLAHWLDGWKPVTE